MARALLDAIRPYRNLKVRGALFGQRRIEADDVARLATLPGRDILLGQLAGAVASPHDHHGRAARGAAAEPGLRARAAAATAGRPRASA